MFTIIFSLHFIIITQNLHIYAKMQERGFIMLIHSAVIGVVLYGIMVLVLKQNPAVAENRSICIAAVVLVYMIVFGHGLPGRVNPQL